MALRPPVTAKFKFSAFLSEPERYSQSNPGFFRYLLRRHSLCTRRNLNAKVASDHDHFVILGDELVSFERIVFLSACKATEKSSFT